MLRALTAEFLGTFAIVLAVCGAVWSGSSDTLAATMALTVGLTLMAMSSALGHVSGAHFNPAVTFGLVAAGRFDMADSPAYIVAQVAGGLAAALLCQLIALDPSSSFGATTLAAATSGFGSGGRSGLFNVVLIEGVATGLFVVVFIGATATSATRTLAPIAIGAAFGALYLITQPISGASLNPARSAATAWFTGWGGIADLWAFWIAPIGGGLAGGFLSRFLQNE